MSSGLSRMHLHPNNNFHRSIYPTSGHEDFKNQANVLSLACSVPPDKSKHVCLIHVIYENDGISAGNE